MHRAGCCLPPALGHQRRIVRTVRIVLRRAVITSEHFGAWFPRPPIPPPRIPRLQIAELARPSANRSGAAVVAG